ncbi:LuxR C-terminal-related transcriptional regulator [Streptomyces sp. NBC_00525]|uniref:LuxR C-terminal-related transcriptional regulator n=1 Tax=Streptomyces sp. NBC_00525 TaxID=2903660 RepID=UPI002E809788|nr:LuxR C-terminal-related transcriptional regulator [Streptomyces sp. NBC_00525]WUC94477.1 LuxR C-terminal-related transcriptional regulator [Streptomyces sp. NBC_00525]
MSAAAYGLAVECGRFDRDRIAHDLSLTHDEIARVESVLVGVRLLQSVPGHSHQLTPVTPDAAAASLVGPAERQIRDLQQAVTEVRAKLMSLTPLYFEGRRVRNHLEAFDIISDPARIQALLDHLGQTCKSELITVQPGGARPADLLDDARASALSILSRGVRIRTIYQHTARNDLPTRSYVRDVTVRGAEVRTADEVIDRLIIYDREVAFLPERSAHEDSPGAAVVREPTLVAFLCSVFEYLWEGATPYVVESQRSPASTDELKWSIIRLMTKGYKDEMVARRLGMSVRTCRRHIAEITEQLEATSRFQAGYNAARLEMLTGDPGRPFS